MEGYGVFVEDGKGGGGSEGGVYKDVGGRRNNEEMMRGIFEEGNVYFGDDV